MLPATNRETLNAFIVNVSVEKKKKKKKERGYETSQ